MLNKVSLREEKLFTDLDNGIIDPHPVFPSVPAIAQALVGLTSITHVQLSDFKLHRPYFATLEDLWALRVCSDIVDVRLGPAHHGLAVVLAAFVEKWTKLEFLQLRDLGGAEHCGRGIGRTQQSWHANDFPANQ